MTLDQIREHFPALARTEHQLPVAYFDGPGGTQVPRVVVEAMSDYLLHHNANTHWRYPTSAETDSAIAYARQAFANFLHCSPEEVAFGANMTTVTFHVARALARSWNEGDEVVVTELDHHANVDPWRAAAQERGLIVRVVPVHTASGELDWSVFEALVSPRTKLVAIGAASNALGTINDLARATRLARAVGALSFVDGVHYTPHVLTDVRALGCDFLACSPYKFYGPHLGVLYGRADLLQALDVPKLAPAPDTAPERLETGTQNHEGIVGAAAAVDFLASLGGGAERRQALVSTYAQLTAHGDTLVERLWSGLSSIDGVRVFGRPPGQPRTPTVAFTVQSRSASEVAQALAARAVFVSHGDFYAHTLVKRLSPGAGGLVRAGCACYTSDDEVHRLIEGVRAIAHSPAGVAMQVS